jgi:hypothetical protein
MEVPVGRFEWAILDRPLIAAVSFDPQANRIATIGKHQFQRDKDLRST